MPLTTKQSKALPIIFIGVLLLVISDPVAQVAKGSVSDLAMAAILLLSPIGLIFFVIGLYRYFRK